MRELLSDKTIKRATGIPWHVWLERLQELNATALAHKDIAAILIQQYHVTPWWAQSLTVRYEQAIGRRLIGQNSKGEFSVSVNKTFPGTVQQTTHWWLETVQGRTNFNGVPIISSSTTNTEKWQYYRAALLDGSRIVIGIYAVTPTKAHLGIRHEKLTSPESSEVWRNYWKSFLTNQ